MTPVEILIKSLLDSKGFQDAEKFLDKMGDSIKQGFGINVGEKILEWIEKVPEKLKEGVEEGIRFNATIEDQSRGFETLLGNITDAQERVRALVEFNEAHPIFGFDQVAEADRFLQVVTKGALSGEEGLKLVGDAAAASQRPLTEVADVIGRLYANLQEGLPIDRSVLALMHMGLISADTARHLREVSEKGEGIGKAMEIVRATFEKDAGAMGRATDTFNGQMKALAVNIESLMGQATKGATEHLKEMLAEINHVISSPELKKLAEIMPAILGAGLQAGTPGSLFGGSRIPLQPSNGGRPRNPSGANAAPFTGSEEAKAASKIAEDADLAWLKLAKDIELNAEGMKDFVEIQNDLEQEQLDKLDSETDSLKGFETLRKQLNAEELQAAQDKLALEQQQFQLKLAALDLDFRRPDYEKRGDRIKLMREEIAATQTLIDKMKEMRAVETEPAAKQALNQQIIGKQGELTQQMIELQKLTQSANPNSYADQWDKALTHIRESWGTTAQQIGEDFQNVVNSAIQSTSHELANAIVLTGDFDTALKNIGVTILEDIIQAIIQMGLRWIATQILTHAVGESLKLTSAATTEAAGLAAAVAWAPAAMAASIATEGEADIEGEIAFDAAMAGALAGFRSGDYTGDGDPSEVAGFAHKGEFYFSAPATRAIGVPTLRAMHQAALNGNAGVAMAMGGGAGGGGGGGGKTPQVHVGFLGDGNAVKEFIESRQGQKLIVDTVQRTVLAMQN
jgi:hypothetical protein